MMATFPWVPSYSSAVDRSPRVRSLQFGDGYEHRAVDGLLPNPAVWRLTFANRTTADALAIETFLNDQGGYTPFLWSPPGAVTTVAAHGFGVGDGSRTLFQLQRTGLTTKNAGDWQGAISVYTTPRTNRITYSEQLDNAAWTKINGGTGVAPVVTPNYAIAPDGTLTADRVVCQNGAGTTGSDYSVVKIADVVGTTAPNERTTRSVWLKSNTGGNLAASLGSNGNAVAITITSTWQRINYTYYHPSLTLTHTIDLGLVGSVAGNVSATIDFSAWGGQLETGTTATPYIPTAAAPVTVNPAYWPALGDGFDPVYSFPSAPSIYVNGVLKTSGTDYTLSATGGVTFTVAPAANAVLTWTGTGTGYRLWVCKKWSRQVNAFNSETLTAEFQEVWG